MTISELFHASKRFLTDFEWLKESKYFEKVDSTQKRITQFLPKTDEGAVLIIGESQSKAVGRQGRPWSSERGGIWFSLALPLKDKKLVDVASFSIVVSHVVVKALHEVNNLDCQVKWPNDIMYENKKLGGILITTTKKFKLSWFIIGVGINVNNELPPELAKIATTIKEVRQQTQGRSRLMESVMSAIWLAWQDFDKTGFGPYQKGVESMLSGIGKSSQIMIGDDNVEGTILGIDPKGALMIKSGENTKTIQAGEIVGQPS